MQDCGISSANAMRYAIDMHRTLIELKNVRDCGNINDINASTPMNDLYANLGFRGRAKPELCHDRATVELVIAESPAAGRH